MKNKLKSFGILAAIFIASFVVLIALSFFGIDVFEEIVTPDARPIFNGVFIGVFVLVVVLWLIGRSRRK